MIVVTDLTFELSGGVKRYISKWIPGDYIAGAPGPPIVMVTETADDAGSIGGSGGGGGGVEQDESTIASLEKLQDLRDKGEKERGQAKERKRRMAVINEAFTDNPMYPFSISEPTVIGVALYQSDRRWTVGRFGEDSQDVRVSSFLTRADRHTACMQYPVAIGFLLVKLNGLKNRVTEFKLKKIVAKSQGMQFSNVNSATIRLRPGRYAIVPYTHVPLDRSMDYILHFNAQMNHIEFEVEDVIAQRLIDDAPSDEEEDEVDDNDLIHYNAETEEMSIMSYEKYQEEDEEDTSALADNSNLSMKAREVRLVAPPSLVTVQTGEYYEDMEELGIVTVFHEVGEIMKYLRNLKGEVHKLRKAISKGSESGAQASQESKSSPRTGRR